ncbi:alpha-amylase family protein [Mycolicibacterium arenosum]|uniref:Glycoside hydrolase family 5 domain-containing protein n=1 Tax=Mycolicibacterium arenosum TaxID=2952157 RepID=A0ABT1M7X8_9MYCO|nr:hypothetical protein [Mycolicibacterium sp. CAU 1645]MCP9275284.1 hypothetical protein [Mycolicibacterium sp. CAU 1645]
MPRHAPAAGQFNISRHIVIVLFALLATGLIVGAFVVSSGAATPDRQFVGRDGTKLVVGEDDYRFTGMNVYMAASAGSCGGTVDLQRAFYSLPRGSVIRFWAFQGFFVDGNTFDWTEFDRVLAVAAAYGHRVIPVLANQHAYCDGPAKDLAWYTEGYRSLVGPGDLNTYRDYVSEVVKRYASNSTIAMWQFINEGEAPGADGSCDEAAAAQALTAFSNDIGSVARGADKNHLFSLGVIAGFNGTGRQYCGAENEDYGKVMSTIGNDVCDYHDYGFPERPLGRPEPPNLLSAMEACRSIGRPTMVAEIGISASSDAMLPERAAMLRSKISGQAAAGVVGELIWCWVAGPQYVQPDGDPNFGVFAGDPAVAVLDHVDD